MLLKTYGKRGPANKVSSYNHVNIFIVQQLMSIIQSYVLHLYKNKIYTTCIYVRIQQLKEKVNAHKEKRQIFNKSTYNLVAYQKYLQRNKNYPFKSKIKNK